MTNVSNKYGANDPAFDVKHGVLKNKLGLTDEQALLQAESAALIAVYDKAAMSYSETHRFTVDDICRLHKMFLGGIFEWAGTYRNIDISSPGIRWCHAKFIESEMARFDGLIREAKLVFQNAMLGVKGRIVCTVFVRGFGHGLEIITILLILPSHACLASGWLSSSRVPSSLTEESLHYRHDQERARQSGKTGWGGAQGGGHGRFPGDPAHAWQARLC